MPPTVFKVSAVNNYVKKILSQVPLLSDIWISGEISNFKRHSSGHLYFALKDEMAAVSAVMFLSDARSLRFIPENGMKVMARGQITLYEKTGQYQFYVHQMQTDGQGALFQAYEALKRKLSEEGLFDQDHKKPIPSFPKKIALVTSKTGAALQDMLQISRRRHPGIQLVLVPVLVQGDQAAPSIVRGLKRADQCGADVVIVGRGGGSMEDLWAFNEEIVARAIYNMNTPVISAVGHEIDFTIADFAADLRAPTPSAAAELAVPLLEDWLEGLEDLMLRQKRVLNSRLQHARAVLEQIQQRPAFRHPARSLDTRRQFLSETGERLENRKHRYFQEQKHKLELQDLRLKLLDPEKPLERGYAYLSDASGSLVTSAEKIQGGDLLTIHLKDGQRKAQALES